MSESFFNKVAGRQNSNFIKKRLHHKFFPVKFAKFLGNLVLETPASASDSFRFSACNFIKKETPAKRDSKCFSVNFAKFLRISFHRTPPDDCFLCLSEDFEKFFRIPLLKSTYGKLPTSCTSCRISTTRYSKKTISQLLFKHFVQNEKQPFEGVHLLKSLKIVWEEVNL